MCPTFFAQRPNAPWDVVPRSCGTDARPGTAARPGTRTSRWRGLPEAGHKGFGKSSWMFCTHHFIIVRYTYIHIYIYNYVHITTTIHLLTLGLSLISPESESPISWTPNGTGHRRLLHQQLYCAAQALKRLAESWSWCSSRWIDDYWWLMVRIWWW